MITTPTTSIMTRLREETRPQHAHAESRPLEQALLHGSLARERFAAYLGQRYLIHTRLEDAVGRLIQRDARLAGLVPEYLLQCGNLTADLKFLGVEPTAIEPLRSTQPFLGLIERTAAHDPVALLGMYYVFEGSKNGAAFIARSVRKAYGWQDGAGTAYLDPHGPRQRELWAAFKAAMDAIAFTAAECDAMINAARATFDAVAAIDDELHRAVA